MEINVFFQKLTNTLWGGYGFQILFYISLILIMVLERERGRKVETLWYSICILLVIYNPVIYVLFRFFFTGKDTLGAYYCRLFCLIPIVFVIAYAMVLVLKQVSGWKKVGCTVFILLAIAASGHSAYEEDWFIKAENVNKVPEDVRQISNLFQEEESVSIMAPTDLVSYMRQVDSRFSMPYGRDRSALEVSDGLQSETPDVEMLLGYAASTETDYLIVLYNEEALEQYMQWGCEVIGYTNRYVVLRQHYPEWILCQYADESGSQAMFYTLRNTGDGSLFVIDGGNLGNESYVRSIITELGGEVTAWIITHYHPDHVSVFNAIYNDPQGILIKEVYAPAYDEDLFAMVAKEWDGLDTFCDFVRVTNDANNITWVKRDMVFDYGNINITFYNCFDELLLEMEPGDILNNLSLVFKVSTTESSMLFVGDCHGNVMSEFLLNRYGQELESDYIQLGHHGNNSLTKEFYDSCGPVGVFFDAPEWLMNGEEYSTRGLADYLYKQGITCYDYSTAPNQIFFY